MYGYHQFTPSPHGEVDENTLYSRLMETNLGFTYEYDNGRNMHRAEDYWGTEMSPGYDDNFNYYKGHSWNGYDGYDEVPQYFVPQNFQETQPTASPQSDLESMLATLIACQKEDNAKFDELNARLDSIESSHRVIGNHITQWGNSDYLNVSDTLHDETTDVQATTDYFHESLNELSLDFDDDDSHSEPETAIPQDSSSLTILSEPILLSDEPPKSENFEPPKHEPYEDFVDVFLNSTKRIPRIQLDGESDEKLDPEALADKCEKLASDVPIQFGAIKQAVSPPIPPKPPDIFENYIFICCRNFGEDPWIFPTVVGFLVDSGTSSKFGGRYYKWDFKVD